MAQDPSDLAIGHEVGGDHDAAVSSQPDHTEVQQLVVEVAER